MSEIEHIDEFYENLMKLHYSSLLQLAKKVEAIESKYTELISKLEERVSTLENSVSNFFEVSECKHADSFIGKQAPAAFEIDYDDIRISDKWIHDAIHSAYESLYNSIKEHSNKKMNRDHE